MQQAARISINPSVRVGGTVMARALATLGFDFLPPLIALVPGCSRIGVTLDEELF